MPLLNVITDDFLLRPNPLPVDPLELPQSQSHHDADPYVANHVLLRRGLEGAQLVAFEELRVEVVVEELLIRTRRGFVEVLERLYVGLSFEDLDVLYRFVNRVVVKAVAVLGAFVDRVLLYVAFGDELPMFFPNKREIIERLVLSDLLEQFLARGEDNSTVLNFALFELNVIGFITHRKRSPVIYVDLIVNVRRVDFDFIEICVVFCD